MPQPAPVRVISAEHQIVQKLHACMGDAASGRAHDLENETVLPSLDDAIDFVNRLIDAAAASPED